MNDTVNSTIKTAELADQQWQAELDRLRINRWSDAATGTPELRRLYDAKVVADQVMHKAFEQARGTSTDAIDADDD
mgnify:CR=1 FL=1